MYVRVDAAADAGRLAVFAGLWVWFTRLFCEVFLLFGGIVKGMCASKFDLTELYESVSQLFFNFSFTRLISNLLDIS